jgi:hypothetical protein
MGVLLNDETLESHLPDVSTCSEVFMVSADMARHEPLHPFTQVLCLFRRNQQVKMIWYQAIGMQPDRIPLDRDQQQFLKCTIILRFMKHFLTVIASVYYVIIKAIS